MARARKPPEAAPAPVDETVEPEPETFGPYRLVDELDGEPVNRVALCVDPVIFLHAGEQFTTQDTGVAALLDAHPAVVKAEG